MNTALKVGAALVVGLLLVILGGGLLLPPEYRVTRSRLIQAPPDRLYAHLDSAAGWERWGVWYRRDPSMRVTASGPSQGAGAHWSWTSTTQGNGGMTLTQVEPNRRVAYTLQFDDFAPSSGEIRLDVDGSGTRVTWVMEGSMGGNPLARWMGFFMDRMVGPDFDAGLANLQQLTEPKAS